MFSANSSQVSEDRLYVEDVFSTYLYTGNDATNNITNGINLTGKGGMVWLKNRASASYAHFLFDTSRGAGYALQSNTTGAQQNYVGYQTFGSSGFSVIGGTALNVSPDPYASWTFRKAPKFFDVVTYTGNGVAGRQIAHSLGVAPGCIFVKCTSNAFGWPVYHRGLTQFGNAGTGNLVLNSTDGNQGGGTFFWNDTDATSTVFTLGSSSNVNQNGATYVAYLFAHDTTSDGIIQCGSYTGNYGSNQSITLGWEPQFVLIKSATTAYNWNIFDTMRGMSDTGFSTLSPNTSNAESGASNNSISPTATGFQIGSSAGFALNESGQTYIYIAIRRGPMRTPTSGTSVFSPIAVTPSSGTVSTTNFPTDMMLLTYRPGGDPRRVYDRLRGIGAQSPPPNEKLLRTNTTDAEIDSTPVTYNWWNTGFTWSGSYAGLSMVSYAFRRAPSFFDEVCYTGNDVGGATGRAISHNLGVAPELLIVKNRTANPSAWNVWHTSFTTINNILLNSNAASNTAFYVWANNYLAVTNPATQFGVYGDTGSNSSNTAGNNYVAYLFSSCPGVSKVGSYTGNGSSQTINCGFAAGARFVLIKRTDSTGDWYVWDTARGIVAGNDPRLSLNSTAAEVTTDDSVDTDSSGFVVNQLSATNINVSSATYIYLAVA